MAAIEYDIPSGKEQADPENSVLCIHRQCGGWSYSLYDRQEKRFVSLYSASDDSLCDPAKAGNDADGHALRLPESAKSILIVSSHASALIPADLYENGRENAFLNLTHPQTRGQESLSGYIATAAATVVYPKPLLDASLQKRPSLLIRHHSEIFLSAALSTNAAENPARVHIHAENGRFDIAVVKENRLTLYNSFLFRAGEDLVYYIMAVYKQLGMDTAHIPIYISGKIAAESELHKLICKYAADVRFEPLHGVIHTAENLSGVPPHMFSILFRSILCVL
jgi:hypothetical protein